MARRNNERNNEGRPRIFQVVIPRVLTYDEPIIEFPSERDFPSPIHANLQHQGTSRDQIGPMTHESMSFIIMKCGDQVWIRLVQDFEGVRGGRPMFGIRIEETNRC